MTDSSGDPLLVFSARGHRKQFWHGQGCPLFELAHPAFLLPTTASPTLEGVPKDGFGEAFVACDILNPCKFPSFDTGLPEEVPVDPQGSRSCSAASRWSCRYREVSSGTWSRKPGSFSQSQQAGSACLLTRHIRPFISSSRAGLEADTRVAVENVDIRPTV